MRRLPVVLFVMVLLFAAACSSSDDSNSNASNDEKEEIPWPAPANPMQKARDAGLQPETAERLEHHVHSHLDVFIDGRPIVIPGGIGIDITDPEVQSGDIDGHPAYGGITTPCDQPCISPLHTHDASGILHTESPVNVDNTLGQFFTEWGVTLNTNCVDTYCKPETDIAIYLDGEKFTGAPRTIALTDQLEIAIVIGKPPARIPSTGDFSQA